MTFDKGLTLKSIIMFPQDKTPLTDKVSREISAREKIQREEKSALLKALRIERLRPTRPQRCQ